MACTKKALLVFITFIVISALVGRIHDAIQYKVESNDNFNRASTDVAPGDEYRHLMFFVQVNFVPWPILPPMDCHAPCDDMHRYTAD